MADEDLENLVLAFEQWAKVAALQLQFVEALGKYKAEVAKAELTLAVAAQEWAVARMKAEVAQELESSLKRLHRFRRQTRQRIERLNRHARAAASIRSGEDLPLSQLNLMWGAYTVFERMAPVTVLQELADTPLPESARAGREYADPGRRHAACCDVPPEIDNVHALIGWLKRRRYVPRRGTSAYRLLLAAFAAIAASAATEMAALQTALEDLQKRTYDTWQPVVIAALPDSVDAKKIVRLGTK